MTARFTFRPLTADDVSMLFAWRSEPHVAAWWDAPESPEALQEECAELTASDEAFPYVALLDGAPVGYVQAYRVMGADPAWWPDETDPHAMGMDQFLGDPACLGRGLGARMAGDFAAMLFEDPAVTKVQVDPAPENERAIATYRRAGFREVGPVETPDGPAMLMVMPRPH